MTTVLAVIPARGGSKGIPQKNILPMAGKPLIAWTIEAALQARGVTRTIVTSDDPKILEVAAAWGAEVPFTRPAALAADDTPALPVIQHAVATLETNDGFRPDIILLLQPTSPLRRPSHIEAAIERLEASNADSIVSVQEVPHQFNPYSVMTRLGDDLQPYLKWDEKNNMRQRKPEFWARNGAAIYGFRYDCLMKRNSLYGDRILSLEMTKEDSIDIDDPTDFAIAEFFLTRRAAA